MKQPQIALNLSSAFFFYDYDTLHVRPFGILELNRLHYARTSGKLRPYVEAISSCIDRDAINLLPSDFYQVAYWLRANSYPNKPFTVEWQCNDPEHIVQTKKSWSEWIAEYSVANPEYKQGDDEALDADLRQEYDAVVASLKNHTPISDKLVEVKMMSQPEMTALYDHIKQCEAKYGVVLTLPTMADMVEDAEMLEQDIISARDRLRGKSFDEIDEKLSEIINNQEDELISELASHLHKQYGDTLRKRMKYLIKLADDKPEVFGTEFYDDVKKLQRLANFGVNETVTVVCRGCGKSSTLHVELELSDFFPES